MNGKKCVRKVMNNFTSLFVDILFEKPNGFSNDCVTHTTSPIQSMNARAQYIVNIISYVATITFFLVEKREKVVRFFQHRNTQREKSGQDSLPLFSHWSLGTFSFIYTLLPFLQALQVRQIFFVQKEIVCEHITFLPSPFKKLNKQ